MKVFQVIFLAIVAASASSSPSSPSSSTCPNSKSHLLWPACSAISQQTYCIPSGDRCDFYLCLENQYHCTGTQYSYPIDYGYKFCERYTSKLQEFDTRGKTWVHDVRLCLQKALVKDAHANSSCRIVYDDAFESHAPCYLENGVCDLSVQDFEAIIDAVGLDTLIDTMRALEQSLDTGVTCVAFWSFLARRDIEKYATELDARALKALLKLAPIGIKKAVEKIGKALRDS